MKFEERLARLKKQADSLLSEIEQLHKDYKSSDRTGASGSEPAEDLRTTLMSILSYIALAPQIEEDELLNTILRCAMHTVNAGGAGLTLLDRKKNTLIFRAAIGDGAEGIIGYEVPVEGSQHGLAFATGEVQSSTPIHSEIEDAAKAKFRNVLVAPLLVDGERVGTMSAVNKQDGDHFTIKDMEAYKLFSDLAAQVVRQRLREEILKKTLNGEYEEAPDKLKGLRFGRSDLTLMSIARDIGKLAREREDLLPFYKQLTGLLLDISTRLGWKH